MSDCISPHTLVSLSAIVDALETFLRHAQASAREPDASTTDAEKAWDACEKWCYSRPIISYLAADPDLSIFYSYIKSDPLLFKMLFVDDPLTVFAPTNAAFEAHGAASFSPESYIVPEEVDVQTSGTRTYQTLSGQMMDVVKLDFRSALVSGDVQNVGGLDNEGQQAGNGVIYSINAILFKPV